MAQGWSSLKRLFNKLWQAELAREASRVESSSASHVSGYRSRSFSDWARRSQQAEREERLRREREIFERWQAAKQEEERLNQWRNKAGTPSDPDSDLEGRLAPSPTPGAYSGGVPVGGEDSAQWIASGRFKTVQGSDNVYAIAYDLQTSSLFVQYKHWAPGMPFGSQSGPGPVYEYKNVSIAEAHAIFRAKSVNEWLWDNVRQRGTWGGHRKPYRLLAISAGYLPRKATWGNDGREWFIRRYMTSASGADIHSQLPDRPAPPMGYDGKPDWSAYRPYRGRPNRGRPNDGRPRNGRRGDSPNVPY